MHSEKNTEGKRKTLGCNYHLEKNILYILVGFLLFASAIVMADENSTDAETDNTNAFQYTLLNTTEGADIYSEVHAGGDVNSYNYIASNGSVQVYVNGKNIVEETDLIKGYIVGKENDWSQDATGVDMGDVVEAFERIALYKAGETDYLSASDRALMNYLDLALYLNIKTYFDENIESRDSALNAYHDAIQNNAYQIEAIYRTLEKNDPDTYCQSRIEVAEKYNLATVKCGLHSKICYNGDLNTIEDGRDYCIHIDNDIDYLPCLNTLGRCGKIVDLKVGPGEAESYIPLMLTYSNPGNMDLNPSVRISLQKPDTNIVVKSYEENLGELLSREEKNYQLFLNTEGVPKGRYELWVTVASGRKEIIEKFDYELLEVGELKRTGDFQVRASGSEDGKTVTLLGSFKNEASVPYSISMNIAVYRDEIKIMGDASQKVYVGPGETAEISYAYNPDAPGNYTIVAGIDKTDLSKSISFSMAAPEVQEDSTDAGLITGDFMVSSSQFYAILAVLALILAVTYTVRRAASSTKSRRALNEELI
ncbi:MAG: hypothetical protein JW727_00175 [Candidatus Aenigmarchaeota archaeon]|nr:hypothetical protein [Candidatus Aenigmarchaeota archaeon]